MPKQPYTILDVLSDERDSLIVLDSLSPDALRHAAETIHKRTARLSVRAAALFAVAATGEARVSRELLERQSDAIHRKALADILERTTRRPSEYIHGQTPRWQCVALETKIARYGFRRPSGALS